MSEFQGVLSKAHWHVPPQTTKRLIGSHVSSVDLSSPFCRCLRIGHVHRRPGQRVRRGGCQQRRRVRHLLWRWRAATRSHSSGTASAQGLLSRPPWAGFLMRHIQYSVTWQEPYGFRPKIAYCHFMSPETWSCYVPPYFSHRWQRVLRPVQPPVRQPASMEMRWVVSRQNRPNGWVLGPGPVLHQVKRLRNARPDNSITRGRAPTNGCRRQPGRNSCAISSTTSNRNASKRGPGWREAKPSANGSGAAILLPDSASSVA